MVKNNDKSRIGFDALMFVINENRIGLFYESIQEVLKINDELSAQGELVNTEFVYIQITEL